MDEGKGGQTRSLQEREGENRKQSANLGRNEQEKKKREEGSAAALHSAVTSPPHTIYIYTLQTMWFQDFKISRYTHDICAGDLTSGAGDS